MLVTRVYLARENSKRNRESHDSKYDEVYITKERADGTTEEARVDKVCTILSILYLVAS